MEHGATAAAKIEVSRLESENILADMDTYLDQLNSVRNRLETIADRVFGAVPANTGEKDQDCGGDFVSKRISSHRRIMDILTSIRGEIERLETF